MKFDSTDVDGPGVDTWQSEELFRQLVQGAKDYAIFMLDLKGNVVTWNTGAQLIMGYTEEEIVGKNISHFNAEASNEFAEQGTGVRDARTTPADILAQVLKDGRT